VSCRQYKGFVPSEVEGLYCSPVQGRITIALAGFLLFLPTIVSAAALPEELAEELRTEILQNINESRAAEGLPPYAENTFIEGVAQAHAEDTAAHFDPLTIETREASYLAHTSSDGGSLRERFEEVGVHVGWGYAENAGYWTRAPFGILQESVRHGLTLIHEGMMAEVPPNDSHRENILGPYTHAGIGLALYDKADAEFNAIFLVTNFSRYTTQEEEIRFRESLQHRPTSPRSLMSPDLIPEHGGPFTDVKPEDAFAGAIAVMKEKKILEGYADGTFRSGDTVSRSEFIKMLLVSVNFSPIGREFHQCFSDVFNEWYAPYICLAKRNGWVTGYDDGSFRPNQSVSRAEGVTLAARILELRNNHGSAPEPEPFPDVPPGAWFESPVYLMADWQLLPFHGSLLKPNLGMTRGEVAEMLARTLELPEKGEITTTTHRGTARSLGEAYKEKE